MNWSAIGAVGEILGAVAVFATLFYLANQIRQTNRATQATIESVMGQWWSQHNREMIHSPEMIEVIETDLSDMKSLSDSDRRRFSWWLASMFYMFDNLYKQRVALYPRHHGGPTRSPLKACCATGRPAVVGLWLYSSFTRVRKARRQSTKALRRRGLGMGRHSSCVR